MYSHLMHIGDVKTKYAIRPNSTPSSSATSRLKERREMEEARKLEHRAVLLDSAPVSNKPAKSSSGLKLRPKGLAPANKGSPLLQSRSGTPIDSYSHSLPASPSMGSGNDSIQNTPTNQTKSSPLKRANSSPGLRRQLIQLLAKGPLARRDIVRDVHFAEPQVISFLDRIASTPDHLQPKTSSNSTSRKFNGPVNRRGSSSSSTPNPSDSGHSTIYLLKDECYPEVLVKDWEDYSLEEKVQVSTQMEVALDKLGFAHNAAEREQLVKTPSEKLRNRLHDNLDDGEELSEEDFTAKSLQTTRPKISGNKKPTTKDRLARAAKGKVSSPRTTPNNAKQTSNPDKEYSAKVTSAQTSGKRNAIASEATGQHDVSNTTKRKSKTVPRVSGNGGVSLKSANRKDIEYTDSSDGEETQKNGRRVTSAGSPNGSNITAESRALADVRVNRIKNGSKPSFNLAREPWLEVRSTTQWHELAKRFHHVYDKYQKGISRVRDEEDMLKSELRLASNEEEERVSSRDDRRNSVSTRSTRLTRGNKTSNNEDNPMLSPTDEREEGEASPTIGQEAQMSTIAFSWRHGGDSKSTESFPSGHSHPMPLEDLEDLVGTVLEMEGQLRRMKDVLQSSKEDLEE